MAEANEATETTETTETTAETEKAAQEGEKVASQANGAAGTTEIPSWRDGITSDDARKFAESSTDLDHLIGRALNLQKQVSKAIVPPGKNAEPEEIAAYHKKIGVPESSEGYEISRPEHIDEEAFKSEPVQGAIGQFREAMHAAGAPAKVVDAAFDAYWKIEAANIQAMKEADERFAKESEADLRKAWRGGEYDKNTEFANKAAARLFGEQLEEARHIEMKGGRFLMDNPIVLKAMAEVGREMAEGGLVPALSESDQVQADEQVREIRAKITEAQGRGDSKEANRLYQEEQKLLAKAKGNQPIVGAQGRAA